MWFFKAALTLAVLNLIAFSAAAQTKAPAKPITFENVIDRSGIKFVLNNGATPEKHQIETMTGGVAVFDYNNDDLLDIYFANGARLPEMDKSDPIFHNRLYRNNGDFTFTDVTDAAGARARVVTSGGSAQHNHATTGVGYISSSDRRVHFGLGAAATVERLEIIWPSGVRQTLTGVKADQILTVREEGK